MFVFDCHWDKEDLFLDIIEFVSSFKRELDLLPHLFRHHNIGQFLPINHIQQILLSQFPNRLFIPLFMLDLTLSKKLTIKFLLSFNLLLLHVYLVKMLLWLGLLLSSCFGNNLMLLFLFREVISWWMFGEFQHTRYVIL